jgi:type VI secretion system secreted protein Hcp
MATAGAGVHAHSDMFLKIDGIDGETKAKGHEKEIQLHGFSFGATQPASSATGGGAGVARVQIHDLSIHKYVDAASPKLFTYCTGGAHTANALLSIRKAGGQQHDYLKIYLKEVLVTNINVTGNEGTSLPLEEVSMTFSAIKIEYHAQDEKGNLQGAVMGSYSLKTTETS